MRVLIACEESQVICKAFRDLWHDAYSCDLKPGKINPEWHYQEDIFSLLEREPNWDLMIGHPDCTYLTVTGNKWFFHPEDAHLPVSDRRPHPNFPDRKQKQKEALAFFVRLYSQPQIPFICLENPVGHVSTNFMKPSQIIQPFQFGHPEPKKTCLWLKGLPLLKGTQLVEPEYHITKTGKRLPKWYAYADKSKGQKHRAEIRSATFPNIAKAMAEQWSDLIYDFL